MIDHTQSRRNFLASLTRLTASALILGSCGGDEGGSTIGPTPEPEPEPDPVLPARQGKSNPFVMPDDRPILVCVEGRNSEAMLSAGLSALGGLSLLVGTDESVFVKPNCNYTDAYPGISRASFVRELALAAVQVTSGGVTVGDMGYHPSQIVYPHMGLDTELSGSGVGLVHLTSQSIRRVAHDHWDESIPVSGVYREIYDSPVVVNCCNLKRHRNASMSCSLKNNVGAVMGPEMTDFRQYLHDLNGDDFQRWVAEIAALVRPELNVVDSRMVLAIDGPLTAWGDPVPTGKIVLCGDMAATDAYCASLLATHDNTFSPAMIDPLLERAEELGLGSADLSQVEVVEITA